MATTPQAAPLTTIPVSVEVMTYVASLRDPIPHTFLKVIFLLLAVILCFNNEAVYAKGLKGSLEGEEIFFVRNNVYPVLIKFGTCKKSTGDCTDEKVVCRSHETLSCDIYEITDERAITEIMLAVLSSELSISSFTFWRSKHNQVSWFEKPLAKFVNNTKGQ